MDSPTITDNDVTVGTLHKHSILFIPVIFVLNILVTGVVGNITLFATQLVFSGVYESNDSMKMIGSFWIAIGVCSTIGLWNPLEFSPVLIIQIIYKGLFLIVEVIPKLSRN